MTTVEDAAAAAAIIDKDAADDKRLPPAAIIIGLEEEITATADISDAMTLAAVKLPKIIVLDLDETVWAFDISTIVPPITKNSSGKIVDNENYELKLFPESDAVIKRILSLGIKLAYASRTGYVNLAKRFLRLLNYYDLASSVQIFPGDKITHFNNIAAETKITYDRSKQKQNK